MPRSRLVLAKLEEVSLVDRGDNPSAHVAFHKRAPGSPDAPPAPPSPAPPAAVAAPPAPSDSVAKRILAVVGKLLGREPAEVRKYYDEAVSFSELEQKRRMRAAINETWDYSYQWQQSISSILADDSVEDPLAKMIESTAQFSAAVTAAATKWVKGETTEGVEKAAATCPDCTEALNDEGACPKCGKTVQKAGRAMSAARLARLTEAASTLSAIIAEVEPAADPAPQEEPVNDVSKSGAAAGTTAATPSVAPLSAEVLKALPEDIRKAIEGMQAQTAAAVAKAEEAVASATTERDLRVTSEIAKRFDTGGDLNGLARTDQLVATLKNLQASSPDEFAALETTLKASAAAIRQGGIFKEIGAGGETPSSDPMAALKVKAEEIRKAAPMLTEAQALDRAITDPANAELVKAYRNQGRS